MSLNLNDAAMAGNVEEVLIRLNMGEDVNQKCYPRSVMGSDPSPSHHTNHSLDSISMSATNSFVLYRYSTPLHDAVCCGRQEVVRILLERGANVNEIDYKDVTPLKLAIRSDCFSLEAAIHGH